MRIALAGMAHESNTFNNLTTGLDTFRLTNGDEYLRKMQSDAAKNDAGKNDARNSSDRPEDGIYETLIEAGMDVVPIFFARAIPSGTVKFDTYAYIKNRILVGLDKNGPWDGICLALHGSMTAEEQSDPEGDLLEAIRNISGCENIPIICALDMHATVTERMASLADGFSAYRTAPHVDTFETGVRTANIMITALKEGKKTKNAFVKVPLLVSGEQSETRVDPAKSLFDSLEEYDKMPNILCSSYVMGFPWADNPHGGAGALVTGWVDDHEELLNHAKKMAAIFWEKRADFTYSTPAMPPEEALKTAIKTVQKSKEIPVIISDSADNPTAGASQDTTRFLQLMLKKKVKNALYTCVADPEAYKQCRKNAIGDKIIIKLGGFYSGKEKERTVIKTKIINFAESNNTNYVVLQTKGVTFTVSDKRCATYDPETLRELGLEPESFNIIGIKAGYLSPEYQAMSKLSILALTDGDTALELRNLPYEKTPRPVYPLDPDMVMEY